ncbi:MAG: hypothetical protein ABSD58_04360 [Verrucomicrobiia bacterium]
MDEGLTRIGQQEFNLTTARGVAPVKGLVMVYRLEPTEGVGQPAGLRQHPGYDTLSRVEERQDLEHGTTCEEFAGTPS